MKYENMWENIKYNDNDTYVPTIKLEPVNYELNNNMYMGMGMDTHEAYDS